MILALRAFGLPVQPSTLLKSIGQDDGILLNEVTTRALRTYVPSPSPVTRFCYTAPGAPNGCGPFVFGLARAWA